jgi:hypothetical protein
VTYTAGTQTVACPTCATASSLTTNAIAKIGTSPALANSSLSDNGTTVTSTENVDIQANALLTEVANAATTGTTVNKLVILTGAPSTAVIAATTTLNGIQGICLVNCGTTGNAGIAETGIASCVFDGATTAGDYVIASTTTAGDCHDAGATHQTSGQVIGVVLSTNTSSTTPRAMTLFGPSNPAGQMIVFSASCTTWSTLSHSANTEETCTVTGVLATDTLLSVITPSLNGDDFGVGNFRVSAANTVTVGWLNAAFNGTQTPPSGTYTFVVLR